MLIRKKFLTHTKVQICLASVFLLLFLVYIAALGLIYFFNFKLMSERTEGLPIHDQLITKMLLVDQSQSLLLWLALATLGYAICSWLYIIVYSHRLTGPVHKLNTILDKAIANKEFPDRVKFRKEDAFHDLASKFNEFVEVMNPDRPKQKAAELNPDITQSPKE